MPFYYDGACADHLRSLGFGHVTHLDEDFFVKASSSTLSTPPASFTLILDSAFLAFPREARVLLHAQHKCPFNVRMSQPRLSRCATRSS